MKELLITVLTPAYNKAKTISRTFESLLRQTQYNFEWIIINDGSKDNTRQVVNSFNTDKFPIIYIDKENEGLGQSFNKGVSIAKGELVFRLDPDDYVTDDAIQQISENYKKISNKKDICSMVFLSIYEDGTLVGYHPFKEEKISDFLEYRQIYKALGDRAEVVKTDVLKEIPYPYFGERICIESLMWTTIAEKYKALYIPIPIYYRIYDENSLSAMGHKKFFQGPKGALEDRSFQTSVMLNRGYYKNYHQVYTIFKYVVGGFRWGLCSKRETFFSIFSRFPIWLSLLGSMPGLLLHLKDKYFDPNYQKI